MVSSLAFARTPHNNHEGLHLLREKYKMKDAGESREKSIHKIQLWIKRKIHKVLNEWHQDLFFIDSLSDLVE